MIESCKGPHYADHNRHRVRIAAKTTVETMKLFVNHRPKVTIRKPKTPNPVQTQPCLLFVRTVTTHAMLVHQRSHLFPEGLDINASQFPGRLHPRTNGFPFHLLRVRSRGGIRFSGGLGNRIRELGGGIQAIRTAAVGTGMSLFEAAVVTSLGMYTAYDIPIPEITPFITVILILLWVAAARALVLLPAIFVTLEKMGIGAVSGGNNMAKKLGLIRTAQTSDDVMEAALVDDDIVDAW